MNPSPRAIWLIAGVTSVAAIASTAWSAAVAARSSAEQLRRLPRVTEQARALEIVRASLPEWATRPAPPANPKSPNSDSLAPRVSAALAAAGLPASALASLSVQSDSDAAPTSKTFRVQHRRATLVLGGVTLPQLGSFLQAWRSREPDWTISGVDAAPDRIDKPTPGADLPLHIVLTLECLSIVSSPTTGGAH